MLNGIARTFARNSPQYRYLYFILSGLRFKSFSAWKKDGEPNPFVRPSYGVKSTSRAEIEEIFSSYRATSSFCKE